MSLHEQIGEDLHVFLDLEDFADMHDVNGVTCRAVVQDISIADDLTAGGGVHLGLYGTLLEVNCRTRDLPEIPVYGQTFRVDGKLYVVVSVTEAMGMLTIKLEANDR